MNGNDKINFNIQKMQFNCNNKYFVDMLIHFIIGNISLFMFYIDLLTKRFIYSSIISITIVKAL